MHKFNMQKGNNGPSMSHIYGMAKLDGSYFGGGLATVL